MGQGSPRFFLALNPVLPNDNFALVVIMTPDAAARDRLKARLVSAVEAGAVPEARVRIDQLNFGPPVGFPVQFRVIGPEPIKVREIAYEVRDAVRSEPKTRDVQLDWNEQVKRVQLVIDQDRVRAIGITPQELAQSLQTLLSGVAITEYREGVELIDVVARAVKSERLDLDRIEDITVSTRSGAAVPLSQVAKVHYGFEEPILWRRNRDMVLTVRADIVKGVQAPDVTKAIWPKLAPIVSALPSGYRLEQGGAIEESAKANAALFKVFPVCCSPCWRCSWCSCRAFRSCSCLLDRTPGTDRGFVRAARLQRTVRFRGTAWPHRARRHDHAQHRDPGGPDRHRHRIWSFPFDAIVESTVRRARPVVLTALAAILGMIPLARSVFWGPMALTIMGGLFVATLLTLVFLPALYAAWFRVKRPTARNETAMPTAPLQPLLAAE